MASDDSSDVCPHLSVGTWVAVKMKSSGERYNGTVTFCDIENNAFGLKDVERAGKGENFSAMEGFYQFERKEVTLIAVTELPPPPSRSSPNQPGPSGYRSVASAPSSPTAAEALEDKKESPSLDSPSK